MCLSYTVQLRTTEQSDTSSVEVGGLASQTNPGHASDSCLCGKHSWLSSHYASLSDLQPG